MSVFNSFSPKTKKQMVGGRLNQFVVRVYFYTMRAVGGTDVLEVAMDKFEAQKTKKKGGLRELYLPRLDQ
ncbi:hypothetical protein SAY87_027787 [Trapa incisa]|uniref:Uncharacterized protein n=1 Tax=Trapa incisa TaxID=236973 RepID=A0AAN7JNA8_9MYRT|nr:hypothetical protein SAY87_027787 [Trapa incisa]